MAVPSNRVPVRVGRGLKSALTAALPDLLEGELVFARDENQLYVVETGALTPIGVSLDSLSVDDIGDVSTGSAVNGELLGYNGTTWSGVTLVIDDLTDVDLTTEAPTPGS